MSLALTTSTQRARADRIETRSIASFLVIAGVVMAGLAVVLAVDVGEPDHDATGAQLWLRWPAAIIVGAFAAVLLGACLRYLCVRLRPVPTVTPAPCHAVVTRRPAAVAGTGTDMYQIDVVVDIEGGRSVASIADAVAPSSIGQFSVGSRWEVHPLSDDPRWVALSESHHEIIRYGYLIHTSKSRSRSHLLADTPGPGSDLAHHDENG
ncbi:MULTISPECIES: hypothetical protein [Rhodococcus erythropolis group]|uniref:Uncharacterized protein n=1 Tax=Rhodococcus erythropolis TaxID=1833 RepID=A0A8I1D3H1_RHOER|nr:MULTISPECIES: hypothetical protein [Rhodococcus erythropolis group]MBH5141960.1 hypothetical protein [Rhodococcus erythropolis]